MTDEIKDNQLNQNIPEQKENVPIAQQPVAKSTTPISAPQENGTEAPEDQNWKAFREARKQDRIQREQAEKLAAQKAQEAEALKQAMEALLNKSAPQPNTQQYNQYYNQQPEESEDEKIEKKVAAILAKREAESEQQRRQREQQEYPQRLQQTYSDFSQIVSSDNLDYLEYHYPEVAGPLKRATDGFDKWNDIYKAVKRFVPNTDHKKELSSIEKNMAKPKSMSTTNITPQAGPSAAVLSEEKRAANWARMQAIMNKAN